MGKKQHQKDKLYLTTTEWKETYGGHKDNTETRLQRAVFKRLPFTHCALSLLPFEDPVCSQEGHIFDISHIIPYLKKYGVNPVTGKRMSAKELIPLKFSRDDSGNFRCPVTFRTFTPASHVVTIRQTGNVYAMEAIQELNLKANFLRDLLTDEPFQRKDIITLQDPNHLEKFNMEQFHHIKLNLKTQAEIAAEKKAMSDPRYHIRHINNEARLALEQLDKQYVPAEKEDENEETADEINAASYSQGRVAAGFTSTAMEPVTHQKAAVLDSDTVKYSRVTKNGYVRIVSNFGAINLELYCKLTPRACENFIVLCKRGYYNNTKFHRVIRHFAMQGGDPTGSGTGGESMWGAPFKDEIVRSLSHDQRGVLSMANRGTDTNQSQFFITFRPCKYLDGKHTIFGRVVGGTDTLAAVERLETDLATNRPFVDVLFLTAEVFVDPFEEAEAAVQKERDDLRAKNKAKDAGPSTAAPATVSHLPKPTVFGSGVGKYLNLEQLSDSPKRPANDSEAATASSEPRKKKVARSQFSDFSTW